MYRVTLSDQQLHQLNRRAHQPGVAPCIRDRLEMLRLAHAGWSIPKIAKHLSQHEQTVRYWVKAFLTGGFDALTDKPHGGAVSALTPALLSAVEAEILKSGRTWNGAQIASLIQERFGIARSPDQVRRKLRQARLRYKRTGRHLHHKQKPEELALSKAELSALEKGAMPAI